MTFKIALRCIVFPKMILQMFLQLDWSQSVVNSVYLSCWASYVFILTHLIHLEEFQNVEQVKHRGYFSDALYSYRC